MLYAFADPIPPGKTDDVRRFYAELGRARKADYDEIARRSGVTAEWYWLQTGSDGDLVVASYKRSTGVRHHPGRSPVGLRALVAGAD